MPQLTLSEISRRGGNAMVKKYGRDHMRRIASKGGKKRMANRRKNAKKTSCGV